MNVFHASVATAKHGRKMLWAGGSGLGESAQPAPFHMTGLACQDCYEILLPEMAEVTWILARRTRIRHIRALYRHKRGHGRGRRR